MNPPATALPAVPGADHGGLLLYRLWHPAAHTRSAADTRTYGPLFRFDPHPERAPADDAGHVPVWYGAETFETAVREVLDRAGPGAGPRPAEVCVRQRMAAVRLPRPTLLTDLTEHAADLGADDDIGDRVEVDYHDTRAWARAIHRDLGTDGLRYHSARHRSPEGARGGVNVVLWSPGPHPTVVSDVPVTTGGAWQRLLTMLVRLDAAPVKVHGCARCR